MIAAVVGEESNASSPIERGTVVGVRLVGLLALAMVFACDAGDRKPVQPRRDDTAVLERELDAVVQGDRRRNRVEAHEIFCATDDDCAMVSRIDCSHCCAERTRQNCNGYRGPFCQCAVNPRNVPACRQHLCVLLTSDEAGHPHS